MKEASLHDLAIIQLLLSADELAAIAGFESEPVAAHDADQRSRLYEITRLLAHLATESILKTFALIGVAAGKSPGRLHPEAMAQ